ncbi:MAG: aminotransferase class V-fold PLP-dependent enzyme [Myxococcota bacterium]|nr:aminotransferase class V-fold PLP-dependent enzyme [Myxococcota bacterium]
MKAILGDRSLFPDLSWSVYLNHAAISPPSLPVLQAAAAVSQAYASQGVTAFPVWMESREVLRGKLARLISAQPEDIALTANTTAGVISVANCFPWKRGDGVVVFSGEFPTNVTPWQQAARSFDLRLTSLPLSGFGDGSGVGLARLEDALKGGVALVAVSAVQFQTGLRMPIKAMADLAHRYGAQLFVDGIQAVGAIPVDARDVDYLAVGSHKWLMGIEGCGFLYVHPDRIGALVPRMAGWLSHEDGIGFLFEGAGHLKYDRPIRRRADFLEAGAYNSAGFQALLASVSLLEHIGVTAISAHITAYLDVLEAGLLAQGFTSLRAADPAARSGILSMLPPEGVDLISLAEDINARSIGVTTPDGRLRFSPHWPNSRDEIPVVLAATEAALRSP